MLVNTLGKCKEGMDINYKGDWGHHPLLVSLANTKEIFSIVNRPGNVHSASDAAKYFDSAIMTCIRGGFRKVRIGGDCKFSQTEYLDGWDVIGVKFKARRLPSLATDRPRVLATTGWWSYMVMTSLAWALKAWSGLLLPISGRHKEQHTAQRSDQKAKPRTNPKQY